MRRFSSFTLLYLLVHLLACQNVNTSTRGKLKSNEIAKGNIGDVLFMDGYISLDEFSKSDAISTIDLDNATNLNIRVYIEKPLTDYLAELDPTINKDELCESGNYQFSFYVDGKETYKENLNIGAGSCEQKGSNKTFSVPLASTENEDSWGRFLWMRFMFRGNGDTALLKRGDHLLQIEIRPYLLSSDLKVGDIIAQGQVNLNVVKPIATPEEIAIQKIEPLDDWPISKDDVDQKKIEELNIKIVEEEFRDIRSIAVIKNGELLIEEYFNGADRETLHDPRSVGKTFASTVMGIALDDGHISDINDPLSKFYNLEQFKNYNKAKEEVTLRNLLMMSSVFDGNDSDYDSPGNEEHMYPTDDWVKFALDLEIDKVKTSGQDWSYFTAGVVVLGDILDKSVPEGLDRYADKKLFKPLDINNYKWEYTPTNVANTAGGIRLRSIDFAKYGQLYKNGGTWNGNRILSKDWVSESLARQIKRPNTDNGYYGFLFWNDVFSVNGKEYEVSFCTGTGGNKIFIFKDLPLVVVVTATAYNMPYAHPQVDKMMEEYILPAVLKD